MPRHVIQARVEVVIDEHSLRIEGVVGNYMAAQIIIELSGTADEDCQASERAVDAAMESIGLYVRKQLPKMI